MVAVSEKYGAWQVRSYKRASQRGWCMPVIIRNGSFFYTKLLAFEDGVVDCWEGLDLALFRKKMQTRWIATETKVGEELSIFNLGSMTVRQSEPLVDRAQIEARVEEAIRYFNPTLSNMVDLHDDPVEVRGKVRYAKLPSLDGRPVRTTPEGTDVMGEEVAVVMIEGDERRVTRWFVYADGMSRFGADGPLISLAEAEQQLLAGETVTLRVQDGRWITLDGVGRAKIVDSHWDIEPEERVKEQRDHYAQLRGEGDAVARCRECLEEFERTQTDSARERLRAAYLEVPKHLRMFCGDMDRRDFPIIHALGMDPLQR